jgi:hypothetical protein
MAQATSTPRAAHGPIGSVLRFLSSHEGVVADRELRVAKLVTDPRRVLEPFVADGHCATWATDAGRRFVTFFGQRLMT